MNKRQRREERRKRWLAKQEQEKIVADEEKKAAVPMPHNLHGIDLNVLKMLCTADEDFFQSEAFGTVVKDPQHPDHFFAYKDNGSNILCVAHLDIAGQLNRKPFKYVRELKTVKVDGKDIERWYDFVVNANLDDRVGVYAALFHLPKVLGINVDVLLTTDEESGHSSASDFQTWWLAKPENERKQYNWIVQFDRHGIDPVTYQYGASELYNLSSDDEADKLARKWDKAVEAATGRPTERGTFTCIRNLDSLGCKAVNWATGYYNEHSMDSYANILHMAGVLKEFKKFWEANKDTYWPHVKRAKTYTAAVQRYSYGGDWDDWSYNTAYTSSGAQQYCNVCKTWKPRGTVRWQEGAYQCDECAKSTSDTRRCAMCEKWKKDDRIYYPHLIKYHAWVCADCRAEYSKIAACEWQLKNDPVHTIVNSDKLVELYPLYQSWVCRACYEEYLEIEQTKRQTEVAQQCFACHVIEKGGKYATTTDGEQIYLCQNCYKMSRKHDLVLCEHCGEYGFNQSRFMLTVWVDDKKLYFHKHCYSQLAQEEGSEETPIEAYGECACCNKTFNTKYLTENETYDHGKFFLCGKCQEGFNNVARRCEICGLVSKRADFSFYDEPNGKRKLICDDCRKKEYEYEQQTTAAGTGVGASEQRTARGLGVGGSLRTRPEATAGKQSAEESPEPQQRERGQQSESTEASEPDQVPPTSEDLAGSGVGANDFRRYRDAVSRLLSRRPARDL